MTDPYFLHVLEQRFKESPPRFLFYRFGSSVHSHPSFDKGPEKPRPDGPLVVSCVALANAAFVTGNVTGLFRCQRPKAERSPEMAFHRIDDLCGPSSVEDGDR